MQRRVERAFRRLLAVDHSKRCPDLLHRERVVADQVTVALDERERGFRGLPVPLDRRRLSPALDVAVAERDVHDVGPVLRLAADDERLREVQADDLGADFHRARE